jgi:NAD(P)-dependent dehydrogenase (short-subunit alcohol dehydrogenase family)
MKFLITGAGRGIGFELALFALEDGHEVLALVRDPHRSSGLQTAKKQYGDKLQIIKCDVTLPEDIHNAAQTIGDTAIDILINNAGIMTDSDDTLQKLSIADMEMTFRTNTFSPVVVVKTFLPNLKRGKSPRLINITSLMGSIADNSSGGYYAYRMSKTALNMFAKSFSIDYPDIITLTLHPGWVRTNMGGPEAPTLPRESARGLYALIKQAHKDQSGHFMDFRGKELPW